MMDCKEYGDIETLDYANTLSMLYLLACDRNYEPTYTQEQLAAAISRITELHDNMTVRD